jgi:predicted O-methyltransferase YrrM
MSEYQFTQDWFHWAPELWQKLIPLLPGKPGMRSFVEVGSFEGRSSVWIIENMMLDGDWLDCIDTWEGGEEHSAEDMEKTEQRFDHNIAVATSKYPERAFTKHKGNSVTELAQQVYKGDIAADFIYIDGSHIAKDVLTDACMAWPLLKPKGIMVFDDYMWGDARDILHRPKWAIDAFVNIFAEEVEIISAGYQLAIRKKEQAK